MVGGIIDAVRMLREKICRRSLGWCGKNVADAVEDVVRIPSWILWYIK